MGKEELGNALLRMKFQIDLFHFNKLEKNIDNKIALLDLYKEILATPTCYFGTSLRNNYKTFTDLLILYSKYL